MDTNQNLQDLFINITEYLDSNEVPITLGINYVYELPFDFHHKIFQKPSQAK